MLRAGVGLLAVLLTGCGKKPPVSPGGPGGAGASDGDLTADAPAVPVRPRRELPAKLFAYWPNDQYTIDYTDHVLAESNPSSTPYFPSGLDKTLGITAAQVTHTIRFSNFARNPSPVEVYLYGLNMPLDLPAVATAAKFTTTAVEGGAVYYPPGPVQQSQILQPAPGVLLVLHRPTSFGKDTKLAAELIRRTPNDTPMPPGLWEVIGEVSGYPRITASTGRRGDDVNPVVYKFRAGGEARTPTHREGFGCVVYASAEEAKRAAEANRQIDAKLDELAKKAPPAGREKTTWIKDNRLYNFSKQPVK